MSTWIKEALNKLIPFMVRQAHHERNQQLTVRPEPVEGLIQSFLKEIKDSGKIIILDNSTIWEVDIFDRIDL
jgi:hypothetical protein